MDFKIDKKELLELAATKLAEMHYNEQQDYDWIKKYVNKEVYDLLNKRVNAAIDKSLSDLMPEILNTKVSPVNIWGEKSGEAKTIKDLLHEKAKNYWDETVDEKGKPCGGYSSSKITRSQFLMGEQLKEEFNNAITKNIQSVIAAMKDSLQEGMMRQAKYLIDASLKTKS